jgi:hypothetical protein
MWNLQICVRLVQRDLCVLVPTIKRRAINIVLWTAILIYIFEYVGLGSVAGLGLFIAASECTNKGYLRSLTSAGRVISDLHGERTLYHYLTLPIPSWLVFVTMALSTTIELIAIDIWVLPVAKLVLWDRFDLSFGGCLKAAAIFLCAHLFYGACFLLFASMKAASIVDFEVKRIRYFEPFFWLSAYWFSWHQAYVKSHLFGYLLFVNPLIYASEGMRSALFDRPESLPLWLCCVVLLVFTAVVGIVGIFRMMKKVDCL